MVRGNVLEVQQANEVVLLIAAGTDYQGFAGRQTRDPVALTLKELNKAADKSYGSLRKAHVRDYQNFFQRVSLQLGPVKMGTTPERLTALKNGAAEPGLAALYFNFG